MELKRKERIQTLLLRLDNLQGGPLGREVDDLLTQEAEQARTSVQNSPTTTAVKKLRDEVMSIKKDPSVRNLSASFAKSQEETKGTIESLSGDFQASIESLQGEIRDAESRGQEMTAAQVKSLLDRFSEMADKFENDRLSLEKRDEAIALQIPTLKQEILPLIQNLEGSYKNLKVAFSGIMPQVAVSQETLRQELNKGQLEAVNELRDRINKFKPGGNMNRNIAISGNTSILSKWTDINLKPGAGTTITYAANDTTGYTDITITATGSGSGITRQVNNISTSQNADATAGIDQVYVASAGVKLTLPTAAGNTNLYTLKNTGTSSVMAVPSGADTIDNDTSAILPVRYTSIDLISDGVSNWNLT